MWPNLASRGDRFMQTAKPISITPRESIPKVSGSTPPNAGSPCSHSVTCFAASTCMVASCGDAIGASDAVVAAARKCFIMLSFLPARHVNGSCLFPPGIKPDRDWGLVPREFAPKEDTSGTMVRHRTRKPTAIQRFHLTAGHSAGHMPNETVLGLHCDCGWSTF